jgi:uncharacterized Zn finger protein (UPF0148 family)
LETNRGNIICPYHEERDKMGAINDQNRNDDSPYMCTGTPYARGVNGRSRAVDGVVNKADRVPRRKGYLHCGCLEDYVLLDFLWWKTGNVDSPVHGKTESWKDQRLDPRARHLMANEWEFATMINIDDMYHAGKNLSSVELEIFWRNRQLVKLGKHVAELKNKLELQEEKRKKAS